MAIAVGLGNQRSVQLSYATRITMGNTDTKPKTRDPLGREQRLLGCAQERRFLRVARVLLSRIRRAKGHKRPR